MPSCAFRWCTNYESKANKAQGISYHMFPIDEVRLQEWITIVRNQRSELDWKPSRSSRICSNHFDANDTYTSKTGRTLLTKDATPIAVNNENQYIKNSPSSLDEVSIPDMEGILEPVRTEALKKRVRVLTFEKKQLQKRNKILALQNKRLNKRIARLAVIIKDLKKKDYIFTERSSKMEIKTEVLD